MEITLPDPGRLWGRRFAVKGASASTDWHTHNLGFFGYMETGAWTLNTPAKSWVMTPGTIGYMPPGVAHSEDAMGIDAKGWIIYLPPEASRKLPTAPCVLALSDLLVSLCQRILDWDREGPLDPPQKRLAAVFLDEIQNATPGTFLDIPLPQSPGLVRICQALAHDPGDNRDLDQLARAAGFSRRSFTRKFQEETGLTLVSWRQRIRLQAGLKKLSQGLSITDIALDLGYQNPSTFIALFRKQFGQAPQQYQRNSRSP